MSEIPATTPTAPASSPSFGAWLQQFLRRDTGQLPVIIAFIAMAVYFQATTQGIFLDPRNLNFLVLESVVIGTVALAAVLVLLLGEIDLSLAAVASLCGAVMTVLSVYHSFPAPLAIIGGLVVGLIIGLINGFIVAYIRVPSFIVTLAALLAYQGVLLRVVYPNNSVRIDDPSILNLTSNYLADWQGYALAAIAILGYAAVNIASYISRRNSKLPVPAVWELGFRIGAVTVAVVVALSVFANYLGVPVAGALLLVFLLVFWLLLRFTTFGRHVYAVGGNIEAARRAGIPVNAVKVAIFGLASMMAAAGGILSASRSTTITPQVSPNLLLNAIAAAVIGGVSLFGGRGSVWAVVLGTLIIGGLLNGLSLQGRTADIQYMVEGSVLLLAVVLDAVLRRRNAVTGR